ncbi:MAG: UDP-2,4-diacetamido-2,4,6-trideoxy-beta-L-altropyranose hydrolase [Vicinamibacterales bacterium]
MKALFRVDASPHIGIGHLMRCLTLAGQLRRNGWTVALVARELPGELSDSVMRQYGLDVLQLPTCSMGGRLGPLTHSHWLGESERVDAEQTLAVLRSHGESIDLMVVDHYGIGTDWEQMIRPEVGRMLVLDDLADRRHECDILLDQNFFPEMEQRYEALVPPGCRLLVGPHYALLREEFQSARATSQRMRSRTGDIRRVLVSFGGTDASGETAKTLEALKRLGDPFEVEVVIGPTNSAGVDIRALAEGRPGVTCHTGVRTMAELMARSDLLVGAGGTTIWEACCVGVPAMVTAIVANQHESCRALAEHGYVVYLGETEKVGVDRIRTALAHLVENPWLVRHLGSASSRLTDGLGVSRVIRALNEGPVTLRRARADDCRDLHEWRNAPENRRHAFDSAPIAYDVHVRWFEDSLRRPDRVLLIGEADGASRGVLRYDLAGTRATVSIYLVPGNHGQGWGARLLRAGTDWLRTHLHEVRVVEAQVMPENAASREAFRRAGYLESHSVFECSLEEEE